MQQCLKNKIFKGHCLGYVNGTTVLHLSKKALPNFEVKIPPKAEAKTMNDALAPYYQRMAEVLQENDRLIHLRDTLLPKLMSGELNINAKIQITMSKSINILDKEYLQWVKDLCGRYRQSQIKAAVKVNVEQLKFNWLLGRDIVELHVEERWGESVITRLSKKICVKLYPMRQDCRRAIFTIVGNFICCTKMLFKLSTNLVEYLKSLEASLLDNG